MGRTTWVCVTCEQHFTRRFSAKRHNDTFHSGNGVISKLANNLIIEKGYSLPKSATSISNSFDKERYSRMISYANQPQENNMKIDNVSGKERTFDTYSQFASMSEPPCKAAERSPFSSMGLLDRYIKIQELDALLFRLGPSQNAKDLRLAAVGIDDSDFLDRVLTAVRNLVRASTTNLGMGFSFLPKGD